MYAYMFACFAHFCSLAPSTFNTFNWHEMYVHNILQWYIHINWYERCACTIHTAQCVLQSATICQCFVSDHVWRGADLSSITWLDNTKAYLHWPIDPLPYNNISIRYSSKVCNKAIKLTALYNIISFAYTFHVWELHYFH